MLDQESLRVCSGTNFEMVGNQCRRCRMVNAANIVCRVIFPPKKWQELGESIRSVGGEEKRKESAGIEVGNSQSGADE